MLISAARVLTPDRVLAPGWVEVGAERVVAVGEGPPARSPDVDLGSMTLVPGFVDAHVHGGGGASYGDGTDAAVRTVVDTHLAHGTTTTMASLVTAPLAVLERTVRHLAGAVHDGLLAGIHLEGPWLSPRQAGAHDVSQLRDPRPADVERLLAAGEGRVRMATLAPELPGGLDAVRQLRSAGVVVAIGHTDASYDVAGTALGAGAGVGTHLFNAMRGPHHREPGPTTALLEDPDAFVELVADGVHLHPAVVRMVAAARPEHALLVTDAMAATGQGDGDYRLGDRQVSVRGGVARLSGSDVIAGSTATLADAVRYAVRVVGLALPDAVRAATTIPASMLGLDQVGALRPGFRADLVALDTDLRVTRVMRAGRWLPSA